MWRDSLRQASFRGIPFHVAAADGSGGRRVALHEYPQRDEPWAEDLGRKARGWTVEAYVLGPDYMLARDRLVDALETEGPGVLVHPYRGTHRVQVTDFRVSESTADGGIARFSITFVEAGEQTNPAAEEDTAAIVGLRADDVTESAKDEFADQFSVEGRPGWVSSAAAEVVADAVDMVGGLADRFPAIPGAASDLTRGLDTLSQGTSDLIHSPANLANEIAGMVGQLGRIVTRPGDALELYKSLYLFGDDLATVPKTTANRRAQASNQDAVTQLVRTTAVAEAARTAARREDQSDTTYASRDDALTVRDDLAEQIDEVSETANDESYQTLCALRAAMVRDLTQRGARLPSLITYTPAHSEPALVTAHRLYGDATRADELLTRNRIRHPGFCPGGEPLEVLTDA